MKKTLNSLIDSVVRETVWSAMRTPDKSAASGRHRGSMAKAYPVPWSIEPVQESHDDHTGFFVGLWLPSDLADQIAIANGESPDDLHVTLFYSKDGNRSQRVEAANAIREHLAQALPVDVKLGGIGRFSASDSSDGKDVIYISVDSAKLHELHLSVCSIAEAAGISVDKTHGFTPHVTIAYVDPSEKTPFNRIKKPIDVTLTQPRIVLGTVPVMTEANQSKTIKHLDDLSPDEFMKFLKAYSDSKIEFSEKLDGSARLEFGFENGEAWTKTKNGQKTFDVARYDKKMFAAIRAAHVALESVEPQEDCGPFIAEILHTKIPNSIEYGKEAIVIHGGDEKAAKELISSLKGKVGQFELSYKRSLDPNVFSVDLTAHVKTLGDLYDKLQHLQPDRLKKSGKEMYSASLAQFKDIQAKVKDALLKRVSSLKSDFGDSDVEGVVARDISTGDLTKIVDRDYFTKLNSFLWHYREMLEKGAGPAGQFKPGMKRVFRDAVADYVLNNPSIKSPTFNKKLLELVSEVGETKALVKLTSSTKPGSAERFAEIVSKMRQQYMDLLQKWNEHKKNPASIDIRGKKMSMDKLHIQRTDDAFEDAEQYVIGMEVAVDAVSAMDDKSAPPAILKVLLGSKLDGREKKMEQLGEKDILAHSDDDGETSDEKHSLLRGVDEKLGRIVLKRFGPLMAKRGVYVSPTAKHLGTGTKGSAFETNDGKVIKVTGDHREAIAANKLKGQKNKHIYNIFDVFQIKGHSIYCVTQEKLEPIPGSAGFQSVNDHEGHAGLIRDAMFMTEFPTIAMSSTNWEEVLDKMQSTANTKLSKMHSDMKKEFKQSFQNALKVIFHFQIDKMFQELVSNGIKFKDYHGGNVMKRPGTNEYVIADIGYSQVQGGQMPDVLERFIREAAKSIVSEAVASTIGVTIGRFQPFHKGHAQIIRDLAKKYSKVIVFVAGLKKDEKNPFSYDLRREIMDASLPDVATKIEVYKAEVGGKQTGYLPALLAKVVKDQNSSLEPEIAANILVGPDRVSDVKNQIAHAEKNQIEGFDPSLFVVEEMSALANDGESDRISGTSIREALKKNDKEAVKKMLDPHIFSNETSFDEIYSKMRNELGLKEMNEDELPPTKQGASNAPDMIQAAGGEDAFAAVLEAHRDRLAKKSVTRWKKLGNGKMGIAYEIDGGRVMKVTTDDLEAKAANAIKGKSYKHLVKIYDVFKFDQKVAKMEIQLYGLLEERLQPLSPTEMREFTSVVDIIFDSRFSKSFTYKSWEEFVMDVRRGKNIEVLQELGVDVDESLSNEELDQFVTKVSGEKPKVAKGIRRIREWLAHFEEMARKFDVDGIMKDLRDANINTADLHEGNLMKRGEDFVMVDLGQSKSLGGEPPMLERAVKAILNMIEAGIPASPTDYAAPNAKVQTSLWSSANLIQPSEQEEEEEELKRLEKYGLPPKF